MKIAALLAFASVTTLAADHASAPYFAGADEAIVIPVENGEVGR